MNRDANGTIASNAGFQAGRLQKKEKKRKGKGTLPGRKSDQWGSATGLAGRSVPPIDARANCRGGERPVVELGHPYCTAPAVKVLLSLHIAGVTPPGGGCTSGTPRCKKGAIPSPTSPTGCPRLQSQRLEKLEKTSTPSVECC